MAAVSIRVTYLARGGGRRGHLSVKAPQQRLPTTYGQIPILDTLILSTGMEHSMCIGVNLVCGNHLALALPTTFSLLFDRYVRFAN